MTYRKKNKKKSRERDEETRKTRCTIRGCVEATPRGRSPARMRVRLSRSSLGGPLTFPRKPARNGGETIPSVRQSEIGAVGPSGDEPKAKTNHEGNTQQMKKEMKKRKKK